MRTRKMAVVLMCIMAAGAVFLPRGACADDRTTSERSSEIDAFYKDALTQYQIGKYDKAVDRLTRIRADLDNDKNLVSWRANHDLMPTREDVVRMIEQVNEAAQQDAQRNRAISREQELLKETQRKRQQDIQAVESKRKQDLAAADLKRKEEQRARKKAEAKARQQALEAQKAEKVRQDKELRSQREAERKAREDLMAQQREQEAQKTKMAQAEQMMMKQERDAAAVRQKAEASKKDEALKAQLASQMQAEKETLAQEKEEALKQKERDRIRALEIQAAKSAIVPPAAPVAAASTDAGIKNKAAEKEVHDREKIARADYLWKEGRRLYGKGMYEEAIKLFKEIIVIEGNPRIKYTPDAQKYIEQAQDKLAKQQETQGDATVKKDVEKIEDKMIADVGKKQIVPYIEPPKKIEEAVSSPLIELSPLRKKLINQKITMDFDKVSLKSVIQFLSQESGVNYVASQKVLDLDPQVTARFNNTPLYDVTKYITKSLGLVYRIDKDVIWIAQPEEIANEAMETRVYYLLKGGGLSADFSPVSAGGSTGLGGSSAQINKTYTIEDTLKEAVQWPADSKLTYDNRLNALIVRNTPQNLQMLEDMLYTLDVDPVQVLIEAKFIEVDITDQKDIGIDWTLDTDAIVSSKKDGRTATVIAKDSSFSFADMMRASEGLNLAYKGVLTSPQFSIVLHALQESKKIKMLSSPRITTLNSQPASIKVVDEWIYPTRYEYQVQNFDLNFDGDYSDPGETTYQNVPKDFLRRDVGIMLKVIPTVGADRMTINLSLIPEVSEAVADAFNYGGDVKLPKFTSRNLATTVVVNSGETVILGGLIKESRTKTVSTVPFICDIPWVGKLFKKTQDLVERKNLLIFVTAKVLTPTGAEVVIKK